MRDYEREILSFLSFCLACTHAHIGEDGVGEAGGRKRRETRASASKDERERGIYMMRSVLVSVGWAPAAWCAAVCVVASVTPGLLIMFIPATLSLLSISCSQMSLVCFT